MVVSVAADQNEKFESAMKTSKVPVQYLGKVAGKEVNINGENWGFLSGWRKTYDEKISSLMN